MTERQHLQRPDRASEPGRQPRRGGVQASLLRLQAAAGNAAVNRLLGHGPRVLARFGEPEHKAIGDKALDAQWKLPGGRLFAETDISFGEWVALGDWFEDINDVKAALRPARKQPVNGSTAKDDTVGQVYYAVLVMIRPKSEGDRKDVEKRYMGTLFNEQDKAAVLKRYKDLKTRNIKHFPNPLVGDTKLTTAEKVNRRGRDGKPLGAIAQYHADHVDAVNLAISAGQLKQERLKGEALAMDGFACHFLTDMFSGSHTRTPRSSIETYWDKKVPGFDTKLVNWLADQVTLVIDKQPSGAKEHFGRELDWTMVREEARKIIRPQVPELSFGDIVGLVVHDWEGAHGSDHHGPLVNVAGQRFRLAGDDAILPVLEAFKGIDTEAQLKAVLAGKLVPKLHTKDPKTHKKVSKPADPSASRTFAAATLAVKASVGDVEKAYELAKKGAKRGAIMAKLVGKDGLFASERLIPTVVPDGKQPEDDRMPKWDFATVDELLASPKIKEALPASAARVAEPFGATVNELDASKAVKDHLQRVVLNPLTSGKVPTIVRWLKMIIAYSPADLEKRLRYHEELKRDLSDLKQTVH